MRQVLSEMEKEEGEEKREEVRRKRWNRWPLDKGKIHRLAPFTTFLLQFPAVRSSIPGQVLEGKDAREKWNQR